MLLLLFGYYKLGGFNPVKVELINTDDYHLLGRHFEGNYQSDTVRLYYNQMRDYVQKGTINGFPAIIYDQEPQGARRRAKSFIGVLLDEPTSIEGLENREINASQAIRVSKEAHISVMPNPDKIERLITSFATENQLTIGPFNIEIFHTENRLVIERPVK